VSTPITPALRSAINTVTAALKGPTPHGPAMAAVLALKFTGQLQSPETAAEAAALRTRVEKLAAYEVLHPQECPEGQHRQWFADVPTPVPCPWCEVARLQAVLTQAGPGCTTSGCGSRAAYLDTSTARTTAWVEVRPDGGAAATALWYCSTLCAALALGGDQIEVALRARLGVELDSAAARLAQDQGLDLGSLLERIRGVETARRLVHADYDASEARCHLCGCTESDPCAGGCAWANGPGARDVCTSCVPAAPRMTPGCGVPADTVDASDPALWGWICVHVGGTDTPMRWVCSPPCAAAAITAGGAELAAQDQAAAGGGELHG
jgi:hypothetical protein